MSDSKIDQFLKKINELNLDALYPTDMKKAIIGYVDRFGQCPSVLLDRTKCIMKRGTDQEEAEEFFQHNTIGSWKGEGTPCFATLVEDVLMT